MTARKANSAPPSIFEWESGPLNIRQPPPHWTTTRVIPLLTAATLVAIAVTVVIWRASGSPGNHLPASVRGEWQTSAPSYANQRLELGDTSVAFRPLGAGAERTWHRILRVRRKREAGGTRFDVNYLDTAADTLPTTLSFVLSTTGTASITFPSQPGVVWTRATPGEPSAR